MSTLVERIEEVAIDDDDRLYEVIDGQRVEKSLGYREILLADDLSFFLQQVMRPGSLGTVAVEVLFDFGREGKPQRRPDLAYVSRERWPVDSERTSENAWKVIPDLAVEVVSASNSAGEIQDKIDEYLEVGVRLVWVIYPTSRIVYVHDGTPNIRVFRPGNVLDGGEVLPDFRLPIASLVPVREKPL